MRDAAAEQDRRFMLLCHELSRINKNVARVAIMPARRGRVLGDDQQGDDDAIPGATPVQTAAKVVGLMPRPTTLHDLWTEWTFGTGGRKPASSFDARERGSVKSAFSFRKLFWEKIDEKVRGGMTAQTACDEIHRAYGQRTSITKILRNMKSDEKSGNWPAALRTTHL